ncbi:MAG TPA: hypothetical protein VNV85_01205 [Puia sp.]|nr:hypothetical protein [Puia sp.]
MDNKKKSATPDEKDAGKYLIGKSHDNEPKPSSGKIQNKSADKKNMAGSRSEEDKSNEPEKRIEINDNPEETERKMPRMKH